MEIRSWGQGNAEEILLYPVPSIRVALTKDAGGAVVTKLSTLHRDALGSVRAVTSAAGLKAERSLFRPFGEEASTRFDLATAVETKGFIGQRHDADAGLQYLNARYYDPKLGMFLQPDWWEVTKAGTNRYGYCLGDPVNCTDASGHVPDNWATKSNPVAYDSNGFKSTYQGKGKLDKVTYTSWNDKNSKDSKKYRDNPTTWDKREGTVGVLSERDTYTRGSYGRGVKTTYGSVEKVRAWDILDPPIQSPFIEADLILAVTGLWEAKAAVSSITLKSAPKLVNSEILVANSKGVWNFGYGTATRTQAADLGKTWVGAGSRMASDGKTLVSADGLRQFRPPTYKPYLDRFQANLEFRLEARGPWIGNAHMDIVE